MPRLILYNDCGRISYSCSIDRFDMIDVTDLYKEYSHLFGHLKGRYISKDNHTGIYLIQNDICIQQARDILANQSIGILYLHIDSTTTLVTIEDIEVVYQ